MKKLHPLLCSILLVVFSGPIYAQKREVLYPKSPSVPIHDQAKSILDPNKTEIPIGQLHPPSGYFVRITERRFVLTDTNELSPEAVLAGPTKTLVFLTTPEGLVGKSLLEIYVDIGYEAEDVLRKQADKDMVAIVFRYPTYVTLSNVENGNLGRDWRNRIYPTTWDNVFSLLTRLVQAQGSAPCNVAGTPPKYICLPSQDRTFVLRFPLAAKRQLKTKTKSYPVLQATGGSLWRYRKLLEDNLSLFEHFRGDGRTENELLNFRDTKSQPRLFEVIGPNMKLSDLSEVVIIHLGKLTVEDDYSRKVTPNSSN